MVINEGYSGVITDMQDRDTEVGDVAAPSDSLEEALFKRTGLPVTVGEEPNKANLSLNANPTVWVEGQDVISRNELAQKAQVALQHPDLVGAEQRDRLLLDMLAGQSPEELEQSNPEIHHLYTELLHSTSAIQQPLEKDNSVEPTSPSLDQQLQRVFTDPSAYDADQLSALVQEGSNHPDEQIRELATKLQEMINADAVANARNVVGLAEAFGIPIQELPVGEDLPEIDATLLESVQRIDSETLEVVSAAIADDTDTLAPSEADGKKEISMKWTSMAVLITLFAADQLFFKGQGADIITTFADTTGRLVRIKNGDFSGFAREPVVRQMQDLLANMPSEKLFTYFDNKTQRELVQTLSQFDTSFRRKLMGGEPLKILSFTKLGVAERTKLFNSMTSEQQNDLGIADLNPSQPATK